jgi:outer membrane protein OmpU
MNKFKKIGVSALAGSLMAVSANAVEMSVSGGASLTFGDYGADITNNAWSSGDGLTFSATGETDGGLTITSSIVLDNGTNDDQSISIASDGMGTITFHALDGGSALSSVDDVMPTAYEEPWFGVTTPTKVDGKAYAGLFQYTSPTVAGATLTATYNQADTTNSDESLTSYAIAWSPEMVDGLTVGYATQDDDSGAATTHVSENTMYAKYVYGPVTVGVKNLKQIMLHQHLMLNHWLWLFHMLFLIHYQFHMVKILQKHQVMLQTQTKKLQQYQLHTHQVV